MAGIAVGFTGCGLVSVMTSPTRSEQKIPAEFKINKSKDTTVAVFVKQPYRAGINANLRYYITSAINQRLVAETEMKQTQVMKYSSVADVASSKEQVQWMDDKGLIDLFDVDFLIVVDIDEFNVKEMAAEGLYKGKLGGNCYLLSRRQGGKVWPRSQSSRNVKVGFELGEKGREAALERLASSYSHCLVRYLYNCPKNEFEAADDRNRHNLEQWSN
jgi:hypothetical protein